MRARCCLIVSLAVALSAGCASAQAEDPSAGIGTRNGDCLLVDSGFGPDLESEPPARVVASGLEVPWGIAFLQGGDMLVTERAGRVRVVEDGVLVDEPVHVVESADSGEGGLLGIALHPRFAENRFFFLYFTVDTPQGPRNRVQKLRLAEDRRGAEPLEIVLDDIPAARFHDGGRLRTGPDGMLYVGTGDARDPALSRDRSSLAGKLLRIDPDGGVPEDNPLPGSPVYLLGLRNLQAFDFLPDGAVVVADHGPSGELGRRGGDEVTIAAPGDDLGWPTIWKCEEQAGLARPALAFDQALPPGGGSIATGDAVPSWRGAFVIGSLGGRHLHVVWMRGEGADRDVDRHAVAYRDVYGRLRDVVVGPDGALYATTSNCDGRGTCPPEGDVVLRIGD